MTEIVLTPRQLCDAECILNGAFSPLTGFCTEAEYNSILENCCLPDGSIWPMPITLDTTKKIAKDISIGNVIALRDPEGLHLADIKISDIWQPDKVKEARSVFATEDETHPGVDYLMNVTSEVYLGGELVLKQLPHHYDFQHHDHLI